MSFSVFIITFIYTYESWNVIYPPQIKGDKKKGDTKTCKNAPLNDRGPKISSNNNKVMWKNSSHKYFRPDKLLFI